MGNLAQGRVWVNKYRQAPVFLGEMQDKVYATRYNRPAYSYDQ